MFVHDDDHFYGFLLVYETLGCLICQHTIAACSESYYFSKCYVLDKAGVTKVLVVGLAQLSQKLSHAEDPSALMLSLMNASMVATALKCASDAILCYLIHTQPGELS